MPFASSASAICKETEHRPVLADDSLMRLTAHIPGAGDSFQGCAGMCPWELQRKESAHHRKFLVRADLGKGIPGSELVIRCKGLTRCCRQGQLPPRSSAEFKGCEARGGTSDDCRFGRFERRSDPV